MKRDVERALADVAIADDAITATACFPPELPVFAGHFPGSPLVPGVFWIEAARCCAERADGEPLRIAEVQEARFTGAVVPGEQVALTVRLERTDAGIVARGEVAGGRGPAAKVRLLLRR